MGQLWLSQLELGAQGDCEGPGPGLCPIFPPAQEASPWAPKHSPVWVRAGRGWAGPN